MTKTANIIMKDSLGIVVFIYHTLVLIIQERRPSWLLLPSKRTQKNKAIQSSNKKKQVVEMEHK
jgi:hypothetical protein